MSEAIQERDEKAGSFKTILIVVLVVLLIPIVTIGVLYVSNESFKQSTNNILSLIPGPAGNYFRSLPTPEDQDILKREIARHYITMDQDRIVDKLLVIRAEDEQLYQDLLLMMNRENPRKMADVTEKLQRAFVNDDTLLRILEEVEQDLLVRSSSLSSYLTSLSRPDAVNEIQRMHRSGEIRSDELGQLFHQFAPAQAAYYMRYLDDSLVQQVRNQLPGSLLSEIDKQVASQLSHEQGLIQQSNLYSSKRVKELIPLLTTENEHPLTDLAFLYHQLSVSKGGRILARSEDPEITQQLLKEMMQLEKLVESREGKTKQLTEAVSVYQDYNRKIQELVAVYQRMDLAELAPLVERMLVSNTIVQQHIFSPEDQIVITEEQLVLDVLNEMRPALISELLGQLSTPRAVLLSQRLYGE
ncbi:hypothetical protein [Anoxynatronum buryatiense]|uniref:Uncharacterized protein n=1 Tax=Anoxynatronum buryatiense TaxID=489973 RepID=A0AA46AI81_9CLOT|nr:hypothetical protein [Anoxynatronum buryatiense]SMP47232.1 hypothetical protein SAMN06296020_103117 [Anoxynatronum buryatiense]